MFKILVFASQKLLGLHCKAQAKFTSALRIIRNPKIFYRVAKCGVLVNAKTDGIHNYHCALRDDTPGF